MASAAGRPHQGWTVSRRTNVPSARPLLVGIGVAALVGLGVASTASAAPPSDTTAPVVDSVTSTDFPPSGSTPTHHAAQAGRLSLTVHDEGSGLANVQWVLDGQFATGSPTRDSRTSGTQFLHGAASATVTVTVTPPSFGNHTLAVRAIDRAGNESQPTSYSFFVPTNPTPQVKGDLTGDGVPDLLVTDAAGELEVLPGTGSGRVGRGVAVAGPSDSVDWRGTVLARITTGLSDVDQVLTHRAGSTTLLQWRNDGIGDLAAPALVMHPFCGAATCPADFPKDFGGLTSMVTTGTGTATTALVTIEGGKAYLYPVGIRIGGGAPIPLDGVDLTRSDLVAPGDVDGDGRPDLWVRDRTTGTLTQFAGTDDGFSSTGTVVADHGFSARRSPVVASVGDLTGDGVGDLVTADAGTALRSRPVTDLSTVGRLLSPAGAGAYVAVEGQPLAP